MAALARVRRCWRWRSVARALPGCMVAVARVLRGFLRWRLMVVVRALNGRFAGVERALCCFARGRPLRCVGCFLFSLLRLLLGLLF